MSLRSILWEGNTFTIIDNECKTAVTSWTQNREEIDAENELEADELMEPIPVMNCCLLPCDSNFNLLAHSLVIKLS